MLRERRDVIELMHDSELYATRIIRISTQRIEMDVILTSPPTRRGSYMSVDTSSSMRFIYGSIRLFEVCVYNAVLRVSCTKQRKRLRVCVVLQYKNFSYCIITNISSR